MYALVKILKEDFRLSIVEFREDWECHTRSYTALACTRQQAQEELVGFLGVALDPSPAAGHPRFGTEQHHL